jgi:polysaccharide export outer membrane protein
MQRSIVRVLRGVALTGVLTVTWPSVARCQDSAAAVLVPGDVVRITVWRQPELSGEFRIMSDGTIGHPLYQAINVRAVPIADLPARVRQFLTTYEQNPQFTLEPLVRVSVGGQVRLPNLYTLPVGTTVSQAIAQAGGVTERGNPSQVRLLRAGRTQVIDLSSAKAGAGAGPVRSGDELFVGQRGNPLRDVIGPLASVLGAAAAIIIAARQ